MYLNKVSKIISTVMLSATVLIALNSRVLATVEEKGSVVSETAKPSTRPINKSELITSKLENTKNTRSILKNVKVTSVGASTITVLDGSNSVTVNISDKTQFRRLFWGKSSLSEISVNDMVDVVGRWTDDTKTAVNAVLIRNRSIQKRYGVFFGTVKSLTPNGFVMSTIQKDDQTVTLGSAKLINRKQIAITSADIKVGDRVRVRGLWDNVAKTITEVKEVKNFSLPLQASDNPKINENSKSKTNPKATVIPSASPVPKASSNLLP